MLQSIRDKTSGWIAYLIIGLISIPFALWGINSYLGGGEETPAAIVDGHEISTRQLDYAYARYRERLSSVFGGSLPAAFDNETTLKEQVLTQIIEERVLQNYIQDRGFRVGDQALFENIQSMEIFQQDGKFSKQLYQNQLASQGYQPALFENELRMSAEMEQLNLAISSTAFTVPVQAELYQQIQNQTRKIRTLTIENTSDDMNVDEQEILDQYENQSGLYMDPAMVKVDYIELSLKKIKAMTEVTEDQLRDRYEQQADQLTTPEVRSASHILLTLDSDASDQQVDQSLQQITDLKTRIEQGEDFAQLAREFSQDPGSAEDGGDLGEVERDMMVKPFEAALFSLSPGQISEPVRTQFGWHLIKLHEVSGGETPTFEQARYDIEQELKTELAESQIYDLAESLANLGYEQPDSIQPAADQLGLEVQTSDWFSRNQGQGIAESDKFRQVAFSNDVLNLNRNSETIELSENRIVIMHLNSQKPATKKPLESVRQTIVDSLKKKKGRTQAQDKGQQIVSELTAGATLDAVASNNGLVINDIGYIKRNSDAVDREVLNAAFTMAKPEGAPVIEGVTELDGDYTIIELSVVNVDKENTKTSTDNDTLKRLNDANANYAYQAFIKSLTERADIVRTPVTKLQ